jgi:hypothetical protein
VGIGSIRKTYAGIGIPASIISVRYHSKKIPYGIVSFRYRIYSGIVSLSQSGTGLTGYGQSCIAVVSNAAVNNVLVSTVVVSIAVVSIAVVRIAEVSIAVVSIAVVSIVVVSIALW